LEIFVSTEEVPKPSSKLDPSNRFRLIFDTTFQFIGLLDPSGTMLEVNRPALAWINTDLEATIGIPVWDTPWWINANEAVRTQLIDGVESAAKGAFVRYDVALRSAAGEEHHFDFSLTPISDHAGKVVYLVAEGRDITALKRLESALREANRELQLAQDQARQLAITDGLTGLYNRRGFFIIGEQHRRLGVRSKTKALLMFADVDGLKQANDEFGHELGDTLLTIAAKALTLTFRASDLIARLGGDEFAVLASISPYDSTAMIADRLRAQLDILNAEAGLVTPLRLSFGMHEFEWIDDVDLETRVAQADAAMYTQKRSRKR
jgi:diguanylate cyclase (GGDEF)-like protein/PAS domain S-box-containing protein